MKRFLKNMGYGLINCLVVFISVILISVACCGLFVYLPAENGYTAVYRFVLSLIELFIGCWFIYVSGATFSKGLEQKGEEK